MSFSSDLELQVRKDVKAIVYDISLSENQKVDKLVELALSMY